MDGSNIAVNDVFYIKHLTKQYGDKVVVNDINMELRQGEFLSLLGPSGSGKTTLLRMISGLIEPERGSILLGDKDYTNIPPNKRNFGMVFQQYALFPHMTVWDNVAYGLRARKESKHVIKEKVNKYLQLVDLSHLAKRKPRELSGGQQQRVSLARALAVEPTLLLFDEPLSNLDARLKDLMLTEIRQLHKQLQFTAIYVTHDQNEALFLSDKIAVLKDGHLKQLGLPNEILNKPNSPFVANFFGYTNKISDLVVQDDTHVVGEGLSIPLKVGAIDDAVGTKGHAYVRPNAITITEFENGATYETHCKATVLDVRLLGGSTEVSLQLVHGETEDVIVANIPRVLSFDIERGKDVSLHFDQESVVFFPADRVDD